MKSGPAPAFVLARVCAPAAQARLPVSDTGSAQPVRRGRHRDRFPQRAALVDSERAIEITVVRSPLRSETWGWLLWSAPN